MPRFLPAVQMPDAGLFLLNTDPTGASAHMTVEIAFPFELDELGVSTRPVFQALLRRGGGIVNDGFQLRIEGTDPNPGSMIFAAVHDEDTTVDVLDPSDPNGASDGGAGDGSVLDAVELRAAMPNPFAHRTGIGFDLRREAKVAIRIYDAQGRQVRAFPETTVAPGSWGIDWDGRMDDGSHTAQGVYFYRLTLDGREAAQGNVVKVQ